MRRFFAEKLFFILALCTLLALTSPGTVAAAPSPQENKPTKLVDKEDKDDAKEKLSAKDSDKEESDKEKENVEKADKSSDNPADKKDQDKADDEAKEKADKAKSAEKKSRKKKAKKSPKTHTVEQDDLKIEVKLKGTFVADEMEEVILRPEVWTRFKVLEAVEHGARVKKGDVLVRFDDEKLEKELADQALAQLTEELALTEAEEDFPRKKRALELSFAAAKRRYEQAKANYDYYYSTDRPITIRLTKYFFKSAKERLATAEEELKQLTQMYEADELTEETEEIVLRRQRFAVETARLSFDLSKESNDYSTNVTLPRTDAAIEADKKSFELTFKQAKTAYEIGMTRLSYSMEKKRNTRAKSVERHSKLLSDKGLMVLRAPCDGVVYYGKQTRGKWSQISSMKAKLKPYGSVSANSVIMTIVKTGGMHVESSLSESNLPGFKKGLTATIIPTADKDMEIEGKVTHVDVVPGASNKFTVTLSADTYQAPEWLAAGLTCEAKVLTYRNKEAVVIPQDLVQTDKDNNKIKYVMLVDPDDEDQEPTRRKVKLGRKQGKIVEILRGLEEGDKIVKEEKKKDKKD